MLEWLLEGALKLKEISYIHAEGFSKGKQAKDLDILCKRYGF